MATSMYYGASKELILYSRQLRLHMTRAEKILWEKIRNKALGHKFRNQHALYKYVVDFFCFEIRLIIEADGEIHTLAENALNDIDRENNLRSLGLHILRFTNDQIFNDIENVLSIIRQTIYELQQNKIILSPPSSDLEA
jgi:very-short-patch-repair endonuclease